MAVFIIDFDFTIAQGHTHNTIARYYKTITGPNPKWHPDEQQDQWQLVKHIPPVFSANYSWKAVFTALLNAHHHVAIASFSSYPHIIAFYLGQNIGLTEDQLSKIHIEAWLPVNPASDNKNQHIANILQHFNFKAEPKNVIFIDDSKINTEAAKTLGFSIIPAHDLQGNPLRDGTHLDNIMQNLEKIS